jgi:integrase
VKLRQVIDLYTKSTRFKNLAYTTKRKYIWALEMLEVDFGGVEITDIKRPNIVRAHDAMGSTPGKANFFACVASSFFNYALDMGYTTENPAVRIKKVKLNTIPRWKVSDIQRVIGLNHRIVSTAVCLAWHTGQRGGDVLNMKWSDIDGNFLCLTQEKTGTKMRIKMNPALSKYLNGLNKKGTYIVSGHGRMSTEAFNGMFRRQLNPLGITGSFHGIRKTVACTLAEKGGSTNEIASLLGHKTLAMAELYTKEANSEKMTSSAIDLLS